MLGRNRTWQGLSRKLNIVSVVMITKSFSEPLHGSGPTSNASDAGSLLNLPQRHVGQQTLPLHLLHRC